MHWYKLAKLNTNVEISPLEEKIFSLIRNVIHVYNLDTTPRVAGGWVRDKVLGKESDDIDISLSNMTGMEFARLLSQYARQNGVEGISGAHKIEAKPEQSKHLETATMSIFGQKVEFMNLRTEDYGDIGELMEKAQSVIDGDITKMDMIKYIKDESATRIPQMQYGDLEEDALRRDLTINSLYYNIMDGQVEDPNGTGLEDLERGLIKAPGDPMDRMAEDPLRALRAIRFASKMGFDIDPTLEEALKDPRTHLLFDMKITPERQAEEIRKIMISKNPAKGMKILHNTGIGNYIFPLPDEYNTWEMEQQSQHHKLNVLEHTLRALDELNQIMMEKDYDDADRFVMNMAAFLHDIGKLDPEIQGTKEVEGEIYKTYHEHHMRSAEIAEKFMRALKLSNKDVEAIRKAIVNHMEPHEHGGRRSKHQLAQFVQRVGNLWEKIIDLGYADTRAKGFDDPEDIAKKDDYRRRVEEIQPEQVLGLRPQMDGNVLQELLNIKPGKYLGQIVNDLKNWQLKSFANTGNIPSIEEEKEYVFNKYAKPLLNGNQIMQLLNIQPGKQLGIITRDLLSKQRTREITTRQQAEQYVQQTYSGGVE